MAKYVKAVLASDGALFWDEALAAEHEFTLAKTKFINEVMERMYDDKAVERTKTFARNILEQAVQHAAMAGLAIPDPTPSIEPMD